MLRAPLKVRLLSNSARPGAPTRLVRAKNEVGASVAVAFCGILRSTGSFQLRSHRGDRAASIAAEQLNRSITNGMDVCEAMRAFVDAHHAGYLLLAHFEESDDVALAVTRAEGAFVRLTNDGFEIADGATPARHDIKLQSDDVVLLRADRLLILDGDGMRLHKQLDLAPAIASHASAPMTALA